MYANSQIGPRDSHEQKLTNDQIGQGKVGWGQSLVASTGNIAPTPLPEIQVELNMLHNSLAHMRNACEEMGNRIRTVSMPQAPTAEPKNQVSGPTSEVAQQIAGAKWQVEGVTASLRAMIDHLCV